MYACMCVRLCLSETDGLNQPYDRICDIISIHDIVMTSHVHICHLKHKQMDLIRILMRPPLILLSFLQP